MNPMKIVLLAALCLTGASAQAHVEKAFYCTSSHPLSTPLRTIDIFGKRPTRAEPEPAIEFERNRPTSVWIQATAHDSSNRLRVTTREGVATMTVSHLGPPPVTTIIHLKISLEDAQGRPGAGGTIKILSQKNKQITTNFLSPTSDSSYVYDCVQRPRPSPPGPGASGRN